MVNVTFNELSKLPMFWILAIAGIVALIFAFRVNARKEKMVAGVGKGMVVLGVGAFAIGALYLSGLGGLITEQLETPLAVVETVTVTTSTSPSASPTVGGKCLGIEDTTVTLSAINEFTTAATGGTHRYRVNKAAPKTVSDTGTFTASPGDNLEILFENGTATSTTFSVLRNEVIPCSGTVEYTARIPLNGTMTVEVFNEEGDLISSTANESLEAGDVVTLESKLKSTYERGFPYGGVITAEYNSTFMIMLL